MIFMTGRKTLDPEEAALFRRVVGRVRPVEDPRPAEHPRPVRRDARRAPGRDAPGAAGPSFAGAGAGERLSYLRPGLQRRVLRQLGRSRWPVEEELHLRGMRAAEALRATADFLRAAQAEGVHCVRIVHGKGRGSSGGRPVIKGELDHWLRCQDAVDAFCSAPDTDGGSGALYVLLRRRR